MGFKKNKTIWFCREVNLLRRGFTLVLHTRYGIYIVHEILLCFVCMYVSSLVKL